MRALVALCMLLVGCGARVEHGFTSAVPDTEQDAGAPGDLDAASEDETIIGVSIGISTDRWCTTLAGWQLCENTCRGHCVLEEAESAVCCVPKYYPIWRAAR